MNPPLKSDIAPTRRIFQTNFYSFEGSSQLPTRPHSV